MKSDPDKDRRMMALDSEIISFVNACRQGDDCPEALEEKGRSWLAVFKQFSRVHRYRNWDGADMAFVLDELLTKMLKSGIDWGKRSYTAFPRAAWLSRYMRLGSIDDFRKKQTQKRRGKPSLSEDDIANSTSLGSSSDDPVKILESKERRDLIENCLKILPKREQECLRLVLDSFENDEIAVVLGIQTAHVRHSFWRARQNKRFTGCLSGVDNV